MRTSPKEIRDDNVYEIIEDKPYKKIKNYLRNFDNIKDYDDVGININYKLIDNIQNPLISVLYGAAFDEAVK